ncbi:MAG: hypothetical protein IT357_11270 [Gemmatimonadaceae bacterium]|nr:hypothetical protein [Gemmatimonadaceae bacterium]
MALACGQDRRPPGDGVGLVESAPTDSVIFGLTIANSPDSALVLRAQLSPAIRALAKSEYGVTSDSFTALALPIPSLKGSGGRRSFLVQPLEEEARNAAGQRQARVHLVHIGQTGEAWSTLAFVLSPGEELHLIDMQISPEGHEAFGRVCRVPEEGAQPTVAEVAVTLSAVRLVRTRVAGAGECPQGLMH